MVYKMNDFKSKPSLRGIELVFSVIYIYIPYNEKILKLFLLKATSLIYNDSTQVIHFLSSISNAQLAGAEQKIWPAQGCHVIPYVLHKDLKRENETKLILKYIRSQCCSIWPIAL